jgi:transformation/transcription domain-associated protein
VVIAYFTRVTGVYFKSLYSLSPEVKEVAHEGLRSVLKHQNRLPKELLQTGLRPILMNLADPKRLSVPGLEGLARLLELLTHYFKVEIGHKLLDHFRIVADPQMLQASSRLPLVDNEGITKLVRLANIFHLLPSAANIFLEKLVECHRSDRSRHAFFRSKSFFGAISQVLGSISCRCQ